MLPDGRAQVPVFGEVGRNYVLETSTDLVQWVPMFSFACTNRVVVLLDASATNVSRRFTGWRRSAESQCNSFQVPGVL